MSKKSAFILTLFWTDMFWFQNVDNYLIYFVFNLLWNSLTNENCEQQNFKCSKKSYLICLFSEDFAGSQLVKVTYYLLSNKAIVYPFMKWFHRLTSSYNIRTNNINEEVYCLFGRVESLWKLLIFTNCFNNWNCRKRAFIRGKRKAKNS